jgi:hypothetical protein
MYFDNNICRSQGRVRAPFLLVVCALLSAIIAVSFLASRPAREVNAPDYCPSILRRIESAKLLWATEHHKVNGDVPTKDDIFGPGHYISEIPKCPQGGVYEIGAIGSPPKCSVPGHTL